jgi:hypothetical protein
LILLLLLLCSASLAASVQDYSRAPRAPEADNIRGTVIFRDESKARRLLGNRRPFSHKPFKLVPP